MGSLAKVATARTKQSTGKKQILMAAPGALHVLLVNLLVVGKISSKPYFDLGTSYEDMMRSVGRSQREMSDIFSNVRRGVEGLGDQFDLLEGHLDNLGQGLNRQFERIGDLNFNLGQLSGPGLVDHIQTSIGGGGDSFGQGFSGIFGRQSGGWWQGENVCKATEVEEDEEMLEGGRSGGPFAFHMEVHSCTQTQDSYVCTHKKGGRAGIVTERTIFSCCPGHRLVSNKCTEVGAMQPLEERMEELGGGEFLELLVENNLAPKLHNVTVFLPSNEAVEEWKVDNMGEGVLDGGDVNTVYM